jgi:hypothetical protein
MPADYYFWSLHICIQLLPSSSFLVNFSGAPSMLTYVGVALAIIFGRVTDILVRMDT